MRVAPVLAAVVVLGVVAAAVGDHRVSPSPRPSATMRVTTPAADTDPLLAFSRPSAPDVGAQQVTYQPSGYAPVDAHGAALRADLTCSGVGTVIVNLTDGTRFTFYCVQQQIDDQVLFDDHPHDKPFLAIAATTGNVVWDLTISAVRNVWRADLD